MMKPKVIARLRYYTPDAKRRPFYASAQADDYLAYMDKGSKAGNYADYLDYAGNEEKSAGVFNKAGLLTKPQKKEMREKLRTTGSCIWDVVLSFEQDYGASHLRDTEDAQALLNARLNRFFRQAGLNPENVTWFAGLHNNTDNRHVHLCFFENEPMRYRQDDRTKKYYRDGRLPQTEINRLKVSIEEYFSDTMTRVKEKRKNLLNTATVALQTAPDFDRKLTRLFVRLLEKVPQEGLLAYESGNMDNVRSVVDEITTCMLLSDSCLKNDFKAFKSALNVHDETICHAAESQKLKHYDSFLLTDKAVADLYRRLGNKVIRQALIFRRQKREQHKAIKRKRYERKKLGDLLEQTARLNAICEQEAADCFREFLDKLQEVELEHCMDEYEM